MRIPKVLKDFAKVFRSAGYDCFLVGGAVRSLIMSLPLGDFDITTNAEPKDVRALFPRVIPTGIKHGTVTVLFHEHQIEVTTYRVEGIYSDGRRPDEVHFVPSLEQDLARRDFTINSIALDPIKGTLIDPNRGVDDIRHKILRAIGDPEERFSEDGLRLMRACRIAAQLEFSIESQTMAGIRNQCNGITNISPERIKDEIIKAIGAPAPSVAIMHMKEGLLLPLVLPELSHCEGVLQKGMHRYDVFHHSLLACDCAPRDNLPVRLAALFHDIGKPDALRYLPSGEPIFYQHENISVDLTRGILRRLRFPKSVELRVLRLIEQHMFNYDITWSDAAVRRFLRRIGPEFLDDLLLLRQADTAGIVGRPQPSPTLSDLKDHVQRLVDESAVFTVRDLEVNGDHLAELGIPRGPEMGKVLNYLLEAVLDDPNQNRVEKLLIMAERFYRTRIDIH